MTSPIVHGLLLVGAVVGLGGCGPPQINTTRLTTSDLVAMTDQMAESMLADAAISSRTSDSQRWHITTTPVTNATNEIIPERERWAFVVRLRTLLNQSPALQERNLRFVLPAERAADIEQGQLQSPEDRPMPTHALTGTFHAATIANRELRSDTYLCTFELVDLRNDRIIWQDRYEVKRAILHSQLD